MMNFIGLIIKLIWVFDVLNFPQFELLDTTFPINTVAWILIFALVFGEEMCLKAKMIEKM